MLLHSTQTNERVQALEKKLSEVQDERTDLLRKRGENAQRVVDLNNTLQEKDKDLSVKEARYSAFLRLVSVTRLQ